MSLERKVHLYDTTLRDGAQGKGVNFSIDGKIKVAKILDPIVDYIEGGWPGANPSDTEFFQRVQHEVDFSHARLTAFGSTRRANSHVESDVTLRALLEARAPVNTIVGKASIYQVKEVLRTTPDENLRMIEESIAYLKQEGKLAEIMYDPEHFFDGYKLDREYALEALRAAARGGADWLVLCDTNGGTFPNEIKRIIRAVRRDEELRRIYKGKVPVGIHAHNDRGLAVANSLAGVDAGAKQVQGTVNGYGERTGNADLIVVMANLGTGYGNYGVTEEQVKATKKAGHRIAYLAGKRPDPKQPFIGDDVFTHKAGLHADGVNKTGGSAYEFIDPAKVDNKSRIVISDLSGKSNIIAKIRELTIPAPTDDAFVIKILGIVKDMYLKGFRYEETDASFELLVRRQLEDYKAPFELQMVESGEGDVTGAIINTEYRFSTHVDPQRTDVTSRSKHINALSTDVHHIFESMRETLQPFYPNIAQLRIVGQDYQAENGSMRRQFVDITDGEKTWRTMGADLGHAKASWIAVSDALEYAIWHATS
jgi:2-isopropylmalate synthase